MPSLWKISGLTLLNFSPLRSVKITKLCYWIARGKEIRTQIGDFILLTSLPYSTTDQVETIYTAGVRLRGT